MFLVRKFEKRDVPDCAMCFYESFFDCPLTENDRAFLRDYAQDGKSRVFRYKNP